MSNTILYGAGNLYKALGYGEKYNIVSFIMFLIPIIHEYIHKYQWSAMDLGGDENRAERKFLAYDFSLLPNKSYMKRILPEWNVEFVSDVPKGIKKHWFEKMDEYYKNMPEEKREKYKNEYKRLDLLKQEFEAQISK